MSNISKVTNYSDDDFEKDYKEYKKILGKMFDEYKEYVKEHTQEEIRKETIMWLKNTRASGGFKNQPQPENNMDFNQLTDNEIGWYFEEWVFPDKFNNGDF